MAYIVSVMNSFVLLGLSQRTLIPRGGIIEKILIRKIPRLNDSARFVAEKTVISSNAMDGSKRKNGFGARISRETDG
jgi:hypothetical protein